MGYLYGKVVSAKDALSYENERFIGEPVSFTFIFLVRA